MEVVVLHNFAKLIISFPLLGEKQKQREDQRKKRNDEKCKIEQKMKSNKNGVKENRTLKKFYPTEEND